jgi:predicted cupin superfamily sugar epimerase
MSAAEVIAKLGLQPHPEGGLVSGDLEGAVDWWAGERAGRRSCFF